MPARDRFLVNLTLHPDPPSLSRWLFLPTSRGYARLFESRISGASIFSRSGECTWPTDHSGSELPIHPGK